ncbi:transcriptional regulator [archaeon]|nr:MAG: transcriptional regulator [archaeon]
MEGERETLISATEKVFRKAGFETSVCSLRSCYDIIARGKMCTFLVKTIPNVDSLSHEYIDALKQLCYYFKAHPIIVSMRTKHEMLHVGVVHSRDDIPVVSIETLEQTVVEDVPPLVYADRGGLYVRIEGELLKRIREQMGFSLSDFAKEIGISRSTLYDYEHSERGIELNTAIKIEDLVDMPLIKPCDLQKRLEIFKEPVDRRPKTSFERDVYALFETIGVEAHPMDRTPFDAVVKEDENEDTFFMLTGISDMDLRSVKKRIMVVREISELLNKDAFFILDAKTTQRIIKGVPIVLRTEMNNISDYDTILEYVKERKEKLD